MGLDGVEVIMTIEEKYGIELPDAPVGIHTVQNLADLVLRLIREQKGSNPDPQLVVHEVIEIIEAMSSKWFRKPTTPDARLSDVLSQ